MDSKRLLVLLLAAAIVAIPAQKRDAKKEAAYKKELASGYIRWIQEDVAYIITDEERRAFNQLGTDDEREQFVEQFWLRRDPTPDTVENEYKEEHYRRIAYSNEHFASGIPGWRTDRGRIYIRFGPTGSNRRPPFGQHLSAARTCQGGGEDLDIPVRDPWRYRHLDNVGEDIEVGVCRSHHVRRVPHMRRIRAKRTPSPTFETPGLTQAEQIGPQHERPLPEHRRHALRSTSRGTAREL